MQLEELLSMKFNTEREKFVAINKLVPRDFDREYFPRRNIDPDFICNIFRSGTPPKGIEEFMSRFGSYYLENEEFRKISDGGTFIFTEGEYLGVVAPRKKTIPGDKEIDEEPQIKIPEGKVTYYAHMYLEISLG